MCMARGTSKRTNMSGKLLVFMLSLVSIMSPVTSFSVYQSKHGQLTSLMLFEPDKLIVAGRNSLYQFSPGNLASSSLDFELDTRCMNRTCNKANLTRNDVSILSEFTDGRHYILFCGTDTEHQCYAIDDANGTQSVKMTGTTTLGSETSAYVVKSMLGGNEYIFSAIDGAYDQNPVLSVKYIHAFQIHFDCHECIKAIDGQRLEFVYGFGAHGIEEHDYVYILRNNRTGVTTKSYISQLCVADYGHLRSYVETEITCGDYSILKSAYFYDGTQGQIMVAAFSSNMHPGSVLCAYDAKVLDQFFRRAKERCFREASGSWPDWIHPTSDSSDGRSCTTRNNKQPMPYCTRVENSKIRASDDLLETPILVDSTRNITSLVMTSYNDTFGVYIGDTTGTVTKMLFDKDYNQSMKLYTVDTGAGTPVRDGMLLDEPRNHLYFTSGDKVVMFKTDNCSLHVTCLGCLTDRASCHWVMVDGSEPFGECVHGTSEERDGVMGNRKVLTDHCLPVIRSVRPLSGPSKGRTLLTLSGQFNGLASDHSRSQVSLGENMSCIITNVADESISCLTEAVAAESFEAALTLTVREAETTRDQTGQLHVPIHGNFSYDKTFVYKTPALNLSVPETFILLSGGVQVQISGIHLDIGATRSVVIGGGSCLVTKHDTVANNTITCRAPGMVSTGTYSTQLVIDGARVTGPNMTYIADPSLESVQPNTVIVSGGVKFTFSGKNMAGMGTSRKFVTFLDSDNTTLNSSTGECFLVGEQLECVSGAANLAATGYKSPLECSVLIKNFYRDAVLFKPYHIKLSIVSDPEFSPLQQIVYFTSLHEVLKLKGKQLLNVDEDEIHITVGPEKCVVTSVEENSLTCSVDVTENMMTGNTLPVKVVIGYRTYELGHATYRLQARLPGSATTAEEDSSGTGVVVAVAACIMSLVFAIACIVVYRKRKRRGLNLNTNSAYWNGDFVTLDGLSETHQAESDQNQRNVYQQQTFAKSAVDEPDASDTAPLLLDENTLLFLERERLLIDRNCLVMAEVIGQGNFGCVYKCYYTIPGQKEEQIVAAKTLHRPDSRDLDVQLFLKEALLMKDFHHCHVMELIGICLGIDRLPLVVLPYMRAGDLLSYLRDAKNSPQVRDLVQFGIDIANGMHYLSQLKFVHRDLAARNCMLSDDLTVKVADFGLSRDVYEKEYYSSADKNAKMPIKWMSPESLEFRVYTSKSDVWSYGVVLWELLTRGMVPYPTVDNWEVLRYMKEGRRMVKPDHCPSKVYKIMQRCWEWDPDDRPTFGDLTIEMPEFLKNSK